MLFTDLAQLSASRVNVSELQSSEAGWEHGPGGDGFVPLCNLVRGCGANAETVVEHPATATRRYVCAGFHTVETVTDALAEYVANAIAVAEYLSGKRE